eukprot:COSAG01_NODE_8101_length_2921_cov_70.806166_5_plen_47_part_00
MGISVTAEVLIMKYQTQLRGACAQVNYLAPVLLTSLLRPSLVSQNG